MSTVSRAVNAPVLIAATENEGTHESMVNTIHKAERNCVTIDDMCELSAESCGGPHDLFYNDGDGDSGVGGGGFDDDAIPMEFMLPSKQSGIERSNEVMSSMKSTIIKERRPSSTSRRHTSSSPQMIPSASSVVGGAGEVGRGAEEGKRSESGGIGSEVPSDAAMGSMPFPTLKYLRTTFSKHCEY
jgi:hypothetical protein